MLVVGFFFATFLLGAPHFHSISPLPISEEGGVTSFAVLQLTDAHLVGNMLPLSAWDIGAVVSWRWKPADVARKLDGNPTGNPMDIWKSHGFLMISGACDDQ